MKKEGRREGHKERGNDRDHSSPSSISSCCAGLRGRRSRGWANESLASLEPSTTVSVRRSLHRKKARWTLVGLNQPRGYMALPLLAPQEGNMEKALDLSCQIGTPEVAVACTANKQDGKRWDLGNRHHYEELRSSVSNKEGLNILGAPSDVGRGGGEVGGRGRSSRGSMERTMQPAGGAHGMSRLGAAIKSAGDEHIQRGSGRLCEGSICRAKGETHWDARKNSEQCCTLG